MKKVFISAILILAAAGLEAAPRYIESELYDCSTVLNGSTPDAENVSLSTSAWTPVPAIANVNERRTVLFVTNLSTNNAVANFIISGSTITPTVSIGIAMFQLQASEYEVLGIDNQNYLFGVSKHTSAESVGTGECQQRP